MIGNVVGNYQIREKLGEGGMGAVYRGIDLMLEREVAIKVLRPELAGQPQLVERFRAEAVTLARLNHPNIATLYSFLRQGDDFLMIMEFVRGETLDSVVRRNGALDPGQAIRLMAQALEGIAHAHQLGIVHRDLKPANIMLTGNGAIKVMDFGIARVLGSARMTKTGRLIGTLEYMSPEQVRGEETDARSDIYALGIVLYELLVGRVPFCQESEYGLMRAQIEDPPPPLRQFAAHIPSPVEQVVLRALAKRPEERFQTADEFRTALLDSLRSVTGSFDHPVVSEARAASAEPSAGFSLPEPVIPETRLAGNGGSRSGADQQFIKETRLAQAESDQPAFQSSFAPHQPQAAHALTSLLNRLNWKHYTAGAAALLVLSMTLIGMIGFGKKPSPSPVEKPSVTAPATTSAPPADPVAPPVDAAPVAPLPSGPLIISREQPPAGRAAQPKRKAVNASARSQSTPASQPVSPARTDAAPPSPATERGRRDESARSGSKDNKVDKAASIIKSAGDVADSIKKLGGLFKGSDKKDREEKKEDKKNRRP